MGKNRVNWSLDRGGKKPHTAGEIIDIPAKEAAELIALGVITPLEAGDEDTTVDDLETAELKTLTKEQLAEYAKRKYAVDLKPAESTKDSMLAAIALCKLEQTKGDAE